MEFQSHDCVVSTELESCLTRNAGPHSAVCTFVAAAEGDDRAACRPPPPLSFYTLTSPPTPNVCFWMTCPAVPPQSETMNGLEN